ncbi:hypothetical protein NHX12_020426 [Muraenolepis orangiensis]|uniref:Forkhead box protein M1 n=1 Tax=Muraenolepis orangiensis TaxID=630683 RepID=A0A9Q0ERF0_9TELE|nr:hypothetical protein NHX12_020426 [Muraenolepis orangiensis]
MRRSPRRPLILKRRKLPFQLSESATVDVVPSKQPHGGGSTTTTTPQPPAPPSDGSSPKPCAVSLCFPDGVHIVPHPTKTDTRVVLIPPTADLQSVIGALTAKGKEHGPNGPNKFILLSGSGGQPCSEVNKDLDCCPLDDSLTNIHWLSGMSSDGNKPDTKSVKSEVKKEDIDINISDNNDDDNTSEQDSQGDGDAEADGQAKSSQSDRPPYSYMAMIQFAINSNTSRRMTLKEIYTWIEDHFPFFHQQTKQGWKNSIRHNLSIHDMFKRQTSPDGKTSYWTIRPEANRCLTLDQVYKLSASTVGTTIYQASPALCSAFTPQVQLLPGRQPARVTPGARKRVRSAPKVAKIDAPAAVLHPIATEMKEEPVCLPLNPQRDPHRGGEGGGGGGGGSSRRKQRLVLPSHEEPILLPPDSPFFDSGVASDASALRDMPQGSPSSPKLSFETPVKGGSSSDHLASSTPSRPLGSEPWKVTPLGKGTQRAMLDFSPIHTPGGPLHTPQHQHYHHTHLHHDYSTFNFGDPAFSELPLFSSPRELLLSSTAAGSAANCSLEGLMLDTINDSLSKVLVDISFSALEDEDMGTANISWSELIHHFI